MQHRTYGKGDEPRLRDCDADYNVFFCPSDPNWGKEHLDVERKFGIEKHSLVANPQFEDQEHNNFRLKKGSPALGLGIEQIDIGNAGLLPDHPFHRLIDGRSK